MSLFLILAAIAVAVSVLVAAPLWRGTAAERARGWHDRAAYRAQLAELDRDRARGLLGEAENASARLEIERRLLATPETTPRPPSRARPLLAALLGLGMVGAALLVYLRLGTPGAPDLPWAARESERKDAAEIEERRAQQEKAAATLESELALDPGNSDGWLMLAHEASGLGQWSKAAMAYAQAIALVKPNPPLFAAYGESLVLAAEGVVTPEAKAQFRQSLALDPDQGMARYYLALGLAQEGDAKGALAAWEALAASPEGLALREAIGRQMETTARTADLPIPPLPPAASGEPQQAMIRGMVDRLAAKLAADPNDVEGWRRLGRSYLVLGEREKAIEAYRKAADLRPEDPDLLQDEVEAMLGGQAPQVPVSPAAVAVLHRLETFAPDRPMVLWYLGLAEIEAHHMEEARHYWTRLLAELPPSSP